jgi:HEAT repeat protein
MSILETFPSETAPAIMQAAWRSDANVRFWTLKLLSKFKPAGCVSQVGLLTGDVSADVRAAACECLGNLGDERGIPALKGCLSDKAWFVRMHAVRALESSIGAECLPFVSGLIKDSSWNAREEVKAAMSRHIEAALPYLAEFLKDKDQITRNDMVEVAERSGFLAAFLQGRAAVNKEKADIARSVIDVICQIRGKNA